MKTSGDEMMHLVWGWRADDGDGFIEGPFDSIDAAVADMLKRGPVPPLQKHVYVEFGPLCFARDGVDEICRETISARKMLGLINKSAEVYHDLGENAFALKGDLRKSEEALWSAIAGWAKTWTGAIDTAFRFQDGIGAKCSSGGSSYKYGMRHRGHLELASGGVVYVDGCVGHFSRITGFTEPDGSMKLDFHPANRERVSK